MYSYLQLSHNGNLVKESENMLNSLLDGDTNTYLAIENPDGTIVGLGKLNENEIKTYHSVFQKLQ